MFHDLNYSNLNLPGFYSPALWQEVVGLRKKVMRYKKLVLNQNPHTLPRFIHPTSINIEPHNYATS